MHLTANSSPLGIGLYTRFLYTRKSRRLYLCIDVCKLYSANQSSGPSYCSPESFPHLLWKRKGDENERTSRLASWTALERWAPALIQQGGKKSAILVSESWTHLVYGPSWAQVPRPRLPSKTHNPPLQHLVQCSHAFFQVVYCTTNVHFECYWLFEMAEMMQGTSSSSPCSVRKRKRKRKQPSSSKTNGQSSACEAVSRTDTSTDCDTSTLRESTTPESSSFETELDWCIQMLELGLLRKNVTDVQRKESNHIVKKLSSDRTPIPRKRQIMRSVFGDYRAQMKVKPLHKFPAVRDPVEKIESVKREKCMTSGQFFKQAASRSSCLIPPASTAEKETIQPFKFDFV